MIEVQELSTREIQELLGRLNYGHLACSDDKKPYVVPVHFAYESPYIYVYTTEGKKSEIIKNNPRVCIEAEEVQDHKNWKSIIIDGEATELNDEKQKERAVAAVTRTNPTLTPAISIHWMDNWIRENIEVIFRITPLEMSGRASVARSDSRAVFVPRRKPAQKAGR
jgi:nitroimidazol reductase NimA-like FMN-containing flavoprotein (pyridoxamine 5'-phosphate oxidase superfamily)